MTHYNYLHHVGAKILLSPLFLATPHGSAHWPYRSISITKKTKINSLKKKKKKKFFKHM